MSSTGRLGSKVYHPSLAFAGPLVAIFYAIDSATASLPPPEVLLTQLGVGGTLVGFAVWLQDRFAKARKIEVDEAQALVKERTDQLIQSLKDQIKGQS